MISQKRYTTEVAPVRRSTRLDFKPVTIDVLPDILRFLRRQSSRSCDYSIGGIYMWIDYFGYEYCITGDTLFIKGLSEDSSRRPAFWVPIGAMPVEDSVAMIRNYCRMRGMEPLFSAVPDDKLELISALPGAEIQELPDWADYVYLASNLATLTGKHYNKKRNHVNRFMADNPDWRLDFITEDNIGEVREFFDRLDNGNDKADPVMAEYESQQCADVLRHFSQYPFKGAVLRDNDGRIVAFTAGEVIGDTLFVHIEKMRHDVAGAGETINKLFAAAMLREHPEIVYINREDDGGDPGLRYAKESYRPTMKVRKYNVTFR